MQNDEDAIRELIANWIRESQAGNVHQVLKLMTEDAVFLLPGQPPMRKAEFAAAQAGNDQFGLQIDSQIQELTVVGDWAYVWNNLTVVLTPKTGGASVRRAGPVLSILKKCDGAWRMFRDANMLAVASR